MKYLIITLLLITSAPIMAMQKHAHFKRQSISIEECAAFGIPYKVKGRHGIHITLPSKAIILKKFNEAGLGHFAKKTGFAQSLANRTVNYPDGLHFFVSHYCNYYQMQGNNVSANDVKKILETIIPLPTLK